MYRSRFFAAQRAGRLSSGAAAAAESHSREVLSVAEARISAARAAAIRERLQEVIDDLAEPHDGAGQDSVQVSVLIGYYSQE